MREILLEKPVNEDSLLRQMLRNTLSLGYYGRFTDRVNDIIIPLAEDFIGFSRVPLKIRKRAFYIFC